MSSASVDVVELRHEHEIGGLSPLSLVIRPSRVANPESLEKRVRGIVFVDLSLPVYFDSVFASLNGFRVEAKLGLLRGSISGYVLLIR